MHVLVAIVAPEVKTTNTRIAQWRNRETILDCRITAFPLTTSYWQKDGRRVTNSARHAIGRSRSMDAVICSDGSVQSLPL